MDKTYQQYRVTLEVYVSAVKGDFTVDGERLVHRDGTRFTPIIYWDVWYPSGNGEDMSDAETGKKYDLCVDDIDQNGFSDEGCYT